MAWIVLASGNQTTTGAEDVLLNDTTTNATFQFAIATTNMAAGDQVTVRVYKKVTGDSLSRVVYKQSFSGAQATDDIVKISAAIGSTNGLKITITRDAGTDRTYFWEVLTVT